LEWALLESLTDTDRRAVLARCRRQRFVRNEVVFREGEIGDAVHLLAKGTVAVRVSTPAGDVVTLDVLRAGEAFGEQALVGDDDRRSATVIALERVETMRLTREDFENLLVTQPRVGRLLVAMLDARLRATSQSLLEALYLAAEARVFRQLGRLAVIYAEVGSGAVPVTQDDLATMAGTTRQTVNRVLRQAQDDGLVVLARGKVEITDAAGLAKRVR
jgi:CRP/FNR family transcriptional regulator, cyclic AMP receptor protein